MNINVNNISPTAATIEIRGTIGEPAQWQEEEPSEENAAASYEKFQAILSEIVEKGVQELRVNIRSMGGSVQDALLIHGALCELKEIQIQTHCYGFVASAATIIAQAASRGKRYVASTALYLIHNSSTQIQGNALGAQAAAAMLEKTDEQIAEIYASRSGRSADGFRALMAREAGQGEWLDPRQVVEAGLADEVEKISTIKNAVTGIRNFLRKLSEVNGWQDSPVEGAPENSTPPPAVFAVVEGAPTATMPKEDPTVENASITLTGNKKSYYQDAENFKD